MMNKQFISLYEKRGYDENVIKEAINYINSLSHFLHKIDQTIDNAPTKSIRSYVDLLISQNLNSLHHILAMARYYYVIDRQDIYIFFTKLLGGVGVLENIQKRTRLLADEKVAKEIFGDFIFPPLGISLEKMPVYISKLMNNFEKTLDEKHYCQILAGNNHGMSEKAMEEEKQLYKQSESLDCYLKERHERKVKELQEHCDQKKVWFEQIVTQQVVDYVKNNQEILSAVRKGQTLYITKIPYEPGKYINEKDKQTKRYYACHCPFVRESIMKDEDISYKWCYCSGGYAKFPFEVILEKELAVQVLSSPLKGDMICRFAIDISD